MHFMNADRAKSIASIKRKLSTTDALLPIGNFIKMFMHSDFVLPPFRNCNAAAVLLVQSQVNNNVVFYNEDDDFFVGLSW